MIECMRKGIEGLSNYVDNRNRFPVAESFEWLLQNHGGVHLTAQSYSPFKNNILINKLIQSYVPNACLSLIVTELAKGMNYEDQIEALGGEAKLISLYDVSEYEDIILDFIVNNKTVILTYTVENEVIKDVAACREQFMKLFWRISSSLRGDGNQITNRHPNGRRAIIVDGTFDLFEVNVASNMAQLRALGFQVYAVIPSQSNERKTAIAEVMVANTADFRGEVPMVNSLNMYVGRSVFNPLKPVFKRFTSDQLQQMDMCNKYIFFWNNIGYLVKIT